MVGVSMHPKFISSRNSPTLECKAHPFLHSYIYPYIFPASRTKAIIISGSRHWDRQKAIESQKDGDLRGVKPGKATRLGLPLRSGISRGRRI